MIAAPYPYSTQQYRLLCATELIEEGRHTPLDFVANLAYPVRVLSIGVVDIRDWALDDPDGRDLDRVREIRDEIEARVTALFDELGSAA